MSATVGFLEDAVHSLQIPHAHVVRDVKAGLEAVIVIDDTTLGPAAGGVRTRAYPSAIAAVKDCARLAHAMTIKCALAGLDAGGGKAVVIDHAGLDRARAFHVLGEAIEALGGAFRTAGDLGTHAADLDVMASATRFVHTDERNLAAAVARGLAGCAIACADAHGGSGSIGEMRVAIQGAGAIGAAVARALAAHGARISIADVEAAREIAIAREIGCEIVRPEELLLSPADLLAPCAIGGVVDGALAARIPAWGVCGAANNVFADDRAAHVLHDRGVLVVPDVLASAGAVIDGIGASVMKLADRTPLIDALAATAGALLRESRDTGRTTTDLAHARARARIAAARRV
ncbi:MAG TPA: Glu/Leu/Phe/Val dehydrogenase dimerization domain-containing protein [Kofleriaceae bacterium]|nr:Glu/Leu/Phe/Val dehydrogenase dimerization domain-containing protein [Kofleriaceae bacterium]